MSEITTAPDPALQTAEEWARLRLAHEAVMLGDAQQVLLQQRAVVDAHNRVLLGAAYQPPSEPDMVHIGDVVYQQPTAAEPAAPRGLGTLGKVAATAALALGGGGAGAGGAWLVDVLSAPSQGTRFELRLPDAGSARIVGPRTP